MRGRKTKIIISITAVFCIIAVVACAAVYKSQSPSVLKLKKQIKYTFLNSKIPKNDNEIEGLDNIKRTELYVNNMLSAETEISSSKDNKKIYITDSVKRLVDYPKGYMLDFPKDTEFEFGYSPIYNIAETGNYKAVVSREYSPYEDIDWYIATYINNFILSDDYCNANNITRTESTNSVINGYPVQRISAVINGMKNDNYDMYTYVLIKTDTRFFYRIMVKYHSADKENMAGVIDTMINSFKYFKAVGQSVYDLDFEPNNDSRWSDETAQIYDTVKNADKIRWGVFAKDIYGEGIEKTVPELEQKIGYKFPVILSYIHFGHDFPTEFMKKNYENGKVVELTYQMTESNNENLYGYTPNIDIYRGVRDDEIRKLAKAAKEFGHPFLFRVNNEMNSDWTSYGGVVNMSDSDIFISNWRRFYDIFEEEGANNVIWIFNPNDRNHPPCDWNNFLAYYPGNDYVHMMGVTGYNNGTYYTEREEKWREFKEIYDTVQSEYEPFFDKFPWIITEFSSSSIGGDKEQWIKNMFENIGRYKNIKIAVWFDYADYDFREGKEDIVARPYWLDETEGTTKAFKDGVAKNGIEGWQN